MTPAGAPLNYTCTSCSFELYVPVAAGARVVVGLYDDGRFPGRCLVVLRDHYDHLDETPEDEVAALFRASTAVATVLRQRPMVTRVNYAVLGNHHPHVHMHVIPRGTEGDTRLARPPWEHPSPLSPLAPEQRSALTRLLTQELLDRL